MKYLIAILLFFSLAACKHEDHSTLIGKWYSEDFWFEFHDGNKYSGGREPVTMQDHEDYVLEPKDKKITIYSSDANDSYYLIYEFKSKDTLVLTNSMNKHAVPAVYYKKK